VVTLRISKELVYTAFDIALLIRWFMQWHNISDRQALLSTVIYANSPKICWQIGSNRRRSIFWPVVGSHTTSHCDTHYGYGALSFFGWQPCSAVIMVAGESYLLAAHCDKCCHALAEWADNVCVLVFVALCYVYCGVVLYCSSQKVKRITAVVWGNYELLF
jgi:hypothetical protein